MSFAEDIKKIRLSAILTQEEFAKEVGVSFATVNRWETGKAKTTIKAPQRRLTVRWQPLWHLTVQSAVAIPTVLRSTMTAAFCLYNFRINSLKSAMLLRELALSLLTFPLFSAMI